MQIHERAVIDELVQSVDPVKGLVATSERTIRPGGTKTIESPDHGKFKIKKDGSFDVPDELAKFLLNQPEWHSGPSPFVTPKE